MPTISVIIPIYNTEKYLRRCLDSILNQEFIDLEILLIDDGSTDNSSMICDKYVRSDSRIKVCHQLNRGVSKARNKGLSLANGEYIHFADSDDFWDNGFYTYMYSKASQHQSEIISSSKLIEKKNGQFIPDSIDEFELTFSKEDALKALFSGKKMSYSLCDKLFKREIIKNIRFNEDISHNEDFLFVYEAIKQSTKVTLTSRAFYHYCNNPNSAVRQSFSHKRMSAIDAHEYVVKDVKLNLKGMLKYANNDFYKVLIYTKNQMETAEYKNKKDKERIKHLIRKNIIKILFSNLALGYKRLALKYSL